MAGRHMAAPRADKTAEHTTTISMPEGLRQQLARHAKRNQRTFAAEVRVRLLASLKAIKALQAAE